jgi:hypothetical protein
MADLGRVLINAQIAAGYALTLRVPQVLSNGYFCLRSGRPKKAH